MSIKSSKLGKDITKPLNQSAQKTSRCLFPVTSKLGMFCQRGEATLLPPVFTNESPEPIPGKERIRR